MQLSPELVAVLLTLSRLLLPLSILRWPLGGFLLAMAADAFDIMIFETVSAEADFTLPYHKIDKLLDTYFLSFGCLATRNWSDLLARRTAQTFFAWRLAGVFVFLLTDFRAILFFAPNIFELFYLVGAAVNKWRPSYSMTRLQLAALLLIVGTPKVAQEYLMHFESRQTWIFLREEIFWWLY